MTKFIIQPVKLVSASFFVFLLRIYSLLVRCCHHVSASPWWTDLIICVESSGHHCSVVTAFCIANSLGTRFTHVTPLLLPAEANQSHNSPGNSHGRTKLLQRWSKLAEWMPLMCVSLALKLSHFKNYIFQTIHWVVLCCFLQRQTNYSQAFVWLSGKYKSS